MARFPSDFPLFGYGTLQVPEVIQAVIGRVYEGMNARLPGYAVYKVKRAEYPGIIRSKGNISINGGKP